MKRDKILVIVKEPGEAARIENSFPNTLEAMQEQVGGPIEAVTLATDVVIICNEEGRLMGLKPNTTVCGVDFVGSIIVAGVSGEDFASLKAAHVPLLMRMVNGGK